ncbi:hypothetical protein Tco_0286467 [Tanacetum coccineum]
MSKAKEATSRIPDYFKGQDATNASQEKVVQYWMKNIFEADECDAFDQMLTRVPSHSTNVHDKSHIGRSILHEAGTSYRPQILPSETPQKETTLRKTDDCVSQIGDPQKEFALENYASLTKSQVKLWYLDSGCSKHMTGNRSKLMNFVEKFIGSVRFGNDHLGAIMGYGDYVIGDSVISRVYYVEGLGHNYLCRQFCDSDHAGGLQKAYLLCSEDSMGTDILKAFPNPNQVASQKSDPSAQIIGTEFVNQVMSEYYEGVGIFHTKVLSEKLAQQKGVLKDVNRTLVEAASYNMIFLKAHTCFSSMAEGSRRPLLVQTQNDH